MIKNFKVQAVYRFAYLVMALVAIIMAIQQNPNGFLLYYTNLSNMIAFIFMLAVFIILVLKIRNQEKYGNNDFYPNIKVMVTVMILVTGIVYNALLGDISSAEYWVTEGALNFRNIFLHLLAPLMILLDWILFDKHQAIKLLDVPQTLIIPYAYLLIIMIRAAFVTEDRFPYFFLHIDEIGGGMVILWVLGLTVFFTLLAMLMWVYDKFVKVDGKIRFVLRSEEKGIIK